MERWGGATPALLLSRGEVKKTSGADTPGLPDDSLSSHPSGRSEDGSAVSTYSPPPPGDGPRPPPESPPAAGSTPARGLRRVRGEERRYIGLYVLRLRGPDDARSRA